jgi:hypothetical protein
MEFTNAQIQQRLAAYCCCYGETGYDRMIAKDSGKAALAAKLWKRMLLLDWAIGVLSLYSEDGECKGQWKPTYEQVCCAISKADPCCVGTGCAPTPPVRLDCTITPFATVIAAIPFDELPIPCSINLDFNNDWNNDWNADVPCVNVQPGDSYYILTGPNAGAVYTWAAQPDFNNDYNFDFNTTQ